MTLNMEWLCVGSRNIWLYAVIHAFIRGCGVGIRDLLQQFV